MRTLVIGDIHEPCAHPGYIHFCRDLRDKYRCDQVVFIGDVVDFQAISFHASRPDLPGPKDEFELAFKGVERWKRVFPEAKVCIGNHDRRVVRLEATARGRRLLEKSRRRRIAYLAAKLRRLPARDRELLDRAAALMEAAARP